MRKHFLLLFLLTLLPLAGWAGQVDYTGAYADLSDGWSIHLSQTAATYTGEDIRPTVTLRKSAGGDDYYELVAAGHFNVSWSATDIIDYVAGGYTVTVTPDETFSYNELATKTANFRIMKANLTVADGNEGALQDNPASGVRYNVNQTITLVKIAPTVKIGATETVVTGLQYVATASTATAAPSTGWSTSYPTAKNVGTYKVWFKAEATKNYNEYVGTVGGDATYAIVGNVLQPTDDYIEPVANDDDLTFTWQNNAAKPLNLIKSNTGKMVGNGKGTMYFAVDPENYAAATTEWTTTATASTAGNHTVYWKIVGAEGYNNIEPSDENKFTKSIGQATTVITFTDAYGQTGLTYKSAGDHKQALIKTVATATKGASSLIKYQARYKASSEIEWNTQAWYPATATADIADITGENAGVYQIRALIEYDANGNYQNTDPKYIEVTIGKANALTAAPTPTTPTWNNAEQKLIAKGTGTVDGVVEYQLEGGAWTSDIDQIVGANAGDYVVKYRVYNNNNYISVPATNPEAGTAIANVKIQRLNLSVKVNDITKTYNAKVDFQDATIDGTNAVAAAPAANNEARFTFMGRIADGLDFGNVAYVALTENCKNADSYTNAVKVSVAALDAVSQNYRYTVIPGNLTIAKAKLRVTADDDIEVDFGKPYDISGRYTIAGLQNNGTADEVATDAFSTVPVLTTDAPAVNPAPKPWDLAFTKGTLKTNGNYEMDTTYGEDDSEAKDGYRIGDAKFTVNADPEAKIIITVLPHTQTYTGVADTQDWDNPVEGVDYIVTGLISGDALTTAPKFKRKDFNDDDDATNDKFDVDTYDLVAYGAAVADITKYPGDIVYQKYTFTITPAKLTATINQQTVIANAPATALDQDAWDVEGLVGPDAVTGKSVLKHATLKSIAYNQDANIEGYAQLATPALYTKGISLTIYNGNYELEGTNVIDGKAYGKLVVTAANTIALQVTDEKLLTKLQDADDNNNHIVDFAGDSRVMEAKEWYAMVLPFETTPLELATKLNTYVVVNKLQSSKIEFNSKTNRDEAVVSFGLEMDKIEAGVPFLVKPAAKTKWNTLENETNTYSARKIKSTVVPTVTEKATFDATYAYGKSLQWGYELDGTTENADLKYRWLANTTDLAAGSTTEYRDNAWYNCKSNAHALEPMEAFLILDPAAQGARIYVEDFDGQTTSIQSLNADQINGLKVAEGWYTINGVKLQGMPTQKGIYINNGKKVVVK